MSQRVNTVEVKVREKSSTAGSQAFQAEVVPNAVYYRAQRMVEDIEKFIRRELESGNRLGFGGGRRQCPRRHAFGVRPVSARKAFVK